MSFGSFERRKAGRVRCVQTRCQLGTITDLSRDGCRVVCRNPSTIPRELTVNLKIVAEDSSIIISAYQVSCRKRTDGKYNVGFRFDHAHPDSRRNILAFARCAQDGSTYSHSLAA
jgi:c-di-GMP-binding flagellar brake protein YcgR